LIGEPFIRVAKVPASPLLALNSCCPELSEVRSASESKESRASRSQSIHGVRVSVSVQLRGAKSKRELSRRESDSVYRDVMRNVFSHEAADQRDLRTSTSVGIKVFLVRNCTADI
jgi:hypothetical protein